MKKLKFNSNYPTKTKDIKLANEEIEKLLLNGNYQNQDANLDNLDVDINHLEKIFTDETYYLAMKIVPLLERKVLYLSYIENIRINDISKRLKLPKNKVISLRNKGIAHFKNNLNTLNTAKNLKKGGK